MTRRFRRYGLSWWPYNLGQQHRWFFTRRGRSRFLRTLRRSDLASWEGKR